MDRLARPHFSEAATAPIEPEAAASDRLWLCLRCPMLPLEVLGAPATRPLAVLAANQRQARVLVCNTLASKQGVKPGLSASAALALSPQLSLLPRDERREQNALRALARLACCYTPNISLQEPDVLLLEISGSLRLYGGADNLHAAFVRAVVARGHYPFTAIAPSARASWWLTLARLQVVITSASRLITGLAPLPLSCLGWPAGRLQRFNSIGVRTLGDCQRLSRDGLYRRFGKQCLQELDEAYARIPEVREWFRPRQHFYRRLELPSETSDLSSLTTALGPLLDQLAGVLIRRQQSVQVVWLCIEHADCQPGMLRLGLLSSSADIQQIRELLDLRLASLSLSAPAIAVAMRAFLVDRSAEQSPGLFHDQHSAAVSDQQLLARLKARLGDTAVHGLQVLAEQRPEYAWRPVADPPQHADAQVFSGPLRQRPLWMLPEPLRLHEVDEQPVYQGQVEFLSGPERIEYGWWDGRDVRRDYYRATNAGGLCLWLFRDLRDGRWFLQGLFE